MTAEERQTKLALNDVRLKALIDADEAQDRDQLLQDLIATEAGPVIRRILSSYRNTSFTKEDREDLLSTVHLRLIGKLRRVLESADHFIRNLNDYVASLTWNALHETMRQSFPERKRLRNRIRYSTQHDERLVLIAEGNAAICATREQGPPFVARSLAPGIGGRLALAGHEEGLGDTLFELLTHAGHPVLLDDVVRVIGDLLNITEAQWTEADETMPDPRQGALAIVQSREYLMALRDEVRELPVMQRSALLLNLRDGEGGCATIFFILTGVMTFDELAGLMDLLPEELASLWNDLPLDDQSIAFRLGRTRQQVINLRKSARERLLRRLQKRGVGRQ